MDALYCGPLRKRDALGGYQYNQPIEHLKIPLLNLYLQMVWMSCIAVQGCSGRVSVKPAPQTPSSVSATCMDVLGSGPGMKRGFLGWYQ